ncbi:MAG TPA: hypothetical protein VNY52_10875 [Solirubrobacteraceae bacterium]|jgi:hypothetical protein|nr:hypothetical protein [Solirubrobacteraceae bacterium]
MSNALRSLKADLLDRRMLPILLLLVAALAGAVAYTALGGGGSSATPVAAVTPTAPPTLGKGTTLPVTQAPINPNAVAAETTDGARYQHKAGSHNPFTPLVSPKASSEATATGKASASSSPSPSSSTASESKAVPSGGSSGGGTTPAQTPTPAAPPKPVAKPKPVYLVTVQFGPVPATSGELSQLTPYSDLKRLQPLPSTTDPRLVFAGARANGKDVVFALGREAIVKGQAKCLPSATQCEAIDLAVEQTEELDYLEPDGQSVPYELKLVSIAKKEATAARAASLDRAGRAGRDLLRRLGLTVLGHLRFSSAKGALVQLAHGGA